MESSQEITVMFTACNAASKEFKYENAPVSDEPRTFTQPIAYAYSDKYENVTVVAADGFVVWGKQGINGVANFKNDGGAVVIKKGEAVLKIPNPVPFQ